MRNGRRIRCLVTMQSTTIVDYGAIFKLFLQNSRQAEGSVRLCFISLRKKIVFGAKRKALCQHFLMQIRMIYEYPNKFFHLFHSVPENRDTKEKEFAQERNRIVLSTETTW